MIRRALALAFLTACCPGAPQQATTVTAKTPAVEPAKPDVPVPTPTPKPPPVATPPSDMLSFEIVEGDIHNYFVQWRKVSAHILASSGVEPRLIVAFPAGNMGVGVWFEKTAKPVQFVATGGFMPLEGNDGMRGVSAIYTADTDKLVTRAAVLGSIRTIRDFIGLHKAPPETAHQVNPGTVAGAPSVVLRRVTADGKHHIELALSGKDGTTLTVKDNNVTITAGPSGTIRVQAIAFQDDPPLTPFGIDGLVTKDAAKSERDLRALAFLTYKEKLLAGSWRFLTYFGRDTLLSLRLMLPVLTPDVVEAGLGAVLERLNVEGDVAHEEDIGDFAALHNAKQTPPPADLEQPIYDYKMVDDDFLLAPILVAYLLDSEAGKARAVQFLSRTTSSGQSYAAALEKNLTLVLMRAKPFAQTPKAKNLIAFKPGLPVGNWRDSREGLGNGRYAFDINVALVPAALEAAARLYESPLLGSKKDQADIARKLMAGWQKAAPLFQVKLPVATATARIKDYASSQGLDPAEAIAAVKAPVTFHALGLDANGKPIPVMHTDDGFVLMFGAPAPAYLQQVAERLTRVFPAGLRTPVGMVVANPVFATDKKLRDMFSRGHYHGAVVWSWQQALLASGLARQLQRTDLPAATRTALEDAERALWDVIDANAEQRTGELWTWDVKDKKIVLVPFGQGAAHADESNAAQLWSTVFLSVKRPARITK
jgi:hypothetical protein